MNLYIASTSGYSGKTLLALGLSRIWSGGGVKVGYVKPLGKIPVVEDGKVVAERALVRRWAAAGEYRQPSSADTCTP